MWSITYSQHVKRVTRKAEQLSTQWVTREQVSMQNEQLSTYVSDSWANEQTNEQLMSNWACRMSNWACRMSNWTCRMSNWACRMSNWAHVRVTREQVSEWLRQFTVCWFFNARHNSFNSCLFYVISISNFRIPFNQNLLHKFSLVFSLRG